MMMTMMVMIDDAAGWVEILEVATTMRRLGQGEADTWEKEYTIIIITIVIGEPHNFYAKFKRNYDKIYCFMVGRLNEGSSRFMGH